MSRILNFELSIKNVQTLVPKNAISYRMSPPYMKSHWILYICVILHAARPISNLAFDRCCKSLQVVADCFLIGILPPNISFKTFKPHPEIRIKTYHMRPQHFHYNVPNLCQKPPKASQQYPRHIKTTKLF